MARYYPGGHSKLDQYARFTTYDPAEPTRNAPIEKKKKPSDSYGAQPAPSGSTTKQTKPAAQVKTKTVKRPTYSLEELVKIAIGQNARGESPKDPPKRCPPELRSQIARYRSFHEWAKDQACYMRLATKALGNEKKKHIPEPTAKPYGPRDQIEMQLVPLRVKRDQLQRHLAAIETQIKKLERKLR